MIEGEKTYSEPVAGGAAMAGPPGFCFSRKREAEYGCYYRGGVLRMTRWEQLTLALQGLP